MSPYAELHCMSNFTFLRGASHPEELVEQASQLGYAALAITDECSMAGVVRAHVAAKRCGLKLVIGSEIRFEEELRLVLLATDRSGYANLSELISHGRRSAGKGSYRLSLDDIPPGMPGCLALLLPHPVPSHAQAQRIAGLFPQRAWLAVELFRDARDAEQLRTLRELGRAVGLPLLAAGDVHIHVAGRRALQDTLTAIRLGATIAEAGQALFPNAERYLRRINDLEQLFPAGLLEQTWRLPSVADFRSTSCVTNIRRSWRRRARRRLEYLTRLAWSGPAALSGRHARTRSAADARARADADRRVALRGLFSHRVGPGALCPARRHPLPGTRLGGQFGGLLLPGRHGGRSRAGMDVLFERFVSRERNEAAGHRRRLRARAARGGAAVSLREVRPRAGRHDRRGDHLSPALGGARRGQGAGAVAGSGRRAGQEPGRASPPGRSPGRRAARGRRSIPTHPLGGSCWQLVERVGRVSRGTSRSTSAAW